MLVLTRKVQEQIRVGQDVVITVLQVKGQSVRLGIEAPRQVRVLRTELSQRAPDDDRPAFGHTTMKPAVPARDAANPTARTSNSSMPDRPATADSYDVQQRTPRVVYRRVPSQSKRLHPGTSAKEPDTGSALATRIAARRCALESAVSDSPTGDR